jgi:peptidyl-prolyl cis-trans isomerase D
MLSFFRRVSKSKIGTWIMAAILIAGLAGFAMSDISNFGTGNIGFGGLGSSTLAKVGDQRVTDQDMSQAMQQRLSLVRQQRPDADYATIAGDFDTILKQLIDQRTLIAFADKYGFLLSKRLVDAEIAQIPGTKGLNGKFSQQAYEQFLSQRHMTDTEVRTIIIGGLLQRSILVPIATNPRVSVGMATPYASMLLEAREGEVAAIPISAFRAGLKPTDSDLQAFYSANRNRYMIPEQRVLRIARIGPEQVTAITASDQEIAKYYNDNKATYAPKDLRTLSQAVVHDQAMANAIATKVKGGAALPAAAGANVAVTTLADQTRADYAGAAGDKIASAVFAAPSGAVVGPIRGDFGWVVVKIEAVKSQSGKSLAQARGEITAKLNVDKRKRAIEDLADKVQSAVDNGGNFNEAAAAAKLPVSVTPLITASGTSLTNAAFKAPPELAPAIKTGFEITPTDPPEILSLPNDGGYAVVSPAQIIPSAPASLASIRDRVANEWIQTQAVKRAKTAATAIAAKAARGVPLDQAAREIGVALPPVQPIAARRIQIATAQGPVPDVMKMLFTLTQGKSRLVSESKGLGFFVVKVDKVVPGNAFTQPNLISQMQTELKDPLTDEYAQQFVAAIAQEMKVRRNDSAINALKTRLVTSGS